jgi:OOP family OmpA-OmpF porin
MRSPVPETSFKPLVLLSLSLLLFGGAARAASPPPLPAGDKPGSADPPFLRRFAGSIVLSYQRKSLDEVSWPLSKLEWVPGQKAGNNNDLAAPMKKKEARGERTTFVYVAPAERSTLEIIESYKDQIAAQKGKLLFACKAAECGGKPTGNSLDGGSRMSLAMYLRSGEEVQEAAWSIPWCAAQVGLTDVRYVLAEIPAQGATVSVMTASPSNPRGDCSALAGHTITLVDVIRAPRAAVNQ